MSEKVRSVTSPGWREDRPRRMIVDSSGRFRIFRSSESGGTPHYLLEDRKDGTFLAFERQGLAIAHAEMVKNDEAHCKWVAEQKKKIQAQVEFRRVSSAGGFYYWKDAAARKAAREARYDKYPHTFGRDIHRR